MKKLTKFVKSCSKLMLLTMAVVLSAFVAKAADPVDLGALEFGKIYSFRGYTPVQATFTSPADGVLTVDGGNDLTWWKDAAHTQVFQGESKGWTQTNGCSGQVVKYNVTKGTTYYLYAKFPMSSQSFQLYMDGFSVEPFNIKYVTPRIGSTFSLTQYQSASIEFTKDVTSTVSSYMVAVKSENGTYTSLGRTNASKSGKFVTLSNVKTQLTHLISNGKLNPGQTFYLVFPAPKSGDQDLEIQEGQNITIEKVGNADCVVIPFICPSIPANFVSKHVPATFFSYWTPGDQDAIVSVTFDKEIALQPRDPKVPQSGSYFSIGYGDLEAEGPNYYYFEDAPMLSEDKKTVYYDLSGVRRTAADMLPLASTQEFPSVTLALCGIVDTYGNPVGTESSVKVGAFSWGVPYKELKKVSFSAEFTPASGADLKEVNEMEVYFASLTGVSFDGFKFSYKENGEEKSVVVKLDECKFVKEGEGGAYTFAIPESIKALGDVAVEVTLANLATNDGFDHSQEVRAAYNTFVLTYSMPANAWESKSIPEDYKFEFSTNWTETYPELYLEYQIRDMNPDDPSEAIVKSAYELSKDESGMWSATMPSELVLYQGHEYHLEVNAWKSVWDMRGQKEPAAMAYVLINGLTQPYVNSTNVLNSISPDPESENFKPLTADDNVITLEFDGPVYLEKATTFINAGFGIQSDFESIEAVDGEVTATENGGDILCSNIWKLTIAKSYLAARTAPVTISFVAYDVQNKILEGNNGKRENSFFSYAYPVANQWADFEIALEPASEEPTSVISFKASASEGIGYNYDESQHGLAQVYDKARNLVATVTEIIDPLAGTGDYETLTTYLTLKLDKEINTPGGYILMIPENFFQIGDQMTARNSMAKNFTFEIVDNGGQQTELNLDVTPAKGSTLKELGGDIVIIFKDYSEIAIGSGKATITHNGVTENLGDAQTDFDVWNKAIQPLGKKYTEAGTYTISFPEGYFGLGADGDPCPAFELTYIVDGGVGVAIVAIDGKYRVYNLNGMLVLETENAADLDNLAAGIYVINGQKVVIRK